MRASRNLAIVLVAGLGLAGCGSGASSSAANAEAAAINDLMLTNDASVETMESPSLTVADKQRVCRAAIADLNGHPPRIVKVVASDDMIVRVKYNRPSDGKAWANECMFEGDRVIWRTVDAFGPGSGLGRWRSGPDDETITYKIEGKRISLKTAYPDGSGGTETYTVP